MYSYVLINELINQSTFQNKNLERLTNFKMKNKANIFENTVHLGRFGIITYSIHHQLC